MRRVLFLVLIFASAVAQAAPRAVLPPDFRPAAFVQTTPDVAANGRDFVAVWTDERMKDRPNFTRGLAVYATRLTDDGQALDPFGIELAPNNSYHALIESNGRSYLVAYNTNAGAWVLRLGTDARPQTAPRAISPREMFDLATNGDTYCALINANFAKSAALVLDDDGRVLQSVPIDGWATSVVNVSGTYVAFTVREQTLVATTIERDGTIATRDVTKLPENASVRAYSNGRRAIVSWVAPSLVEYVVLDHRAQPVAAVRRVAGGEALMFAAGPPSLAWDGGSFAVMWREGYGSLRAVRVASNARLLDETPIAVDSTADEIRAAFNDFRVMLVSSEVMSEAPDAVSRVVTSFQSLSDLPDPHVIAIGATPQSEPDVAASGNVAMAVAREGESYGAIAGAIFAPAAAGSELRVLLAPPQPHTFQDGPSVAAAGDLFLVAWREAGDPRTRILAKRVTANGTVLDAEPLVVAEEQRSFANFADTDISYDGEAFLVVWHSRDDEIRARRVGRDGVFLTPAFTVSRHAADEKRERRTPAVVWTGSTHLVVWSESLPLVGNVSPENPLRNAYRAARVSRDGVVLDADESLLLFIVDGYSHGVALAASKERVLLVTATGAYLSNSQWPVHTLLFDAQGNALADEPSRIDHEALFARRMHPAAAWDGASFLVFWNERTSEYASALTARKIDANGEVSGGLALSGGTSFFPAAATIERGALLVETATRPEQTNTARLFAHTFLHSARMRAARH